MNGTKEYLRLSKSYCEQIGGVRWSGDEDALAFPDGTIFAFNEELALFLEGFTDSGRLIHFCQLLHLVGIVKNVLRTGDPDSLRLSYAFANTGRSVRNAGAFGAILCAGLPEVPNTVEVREVLERLRNRSFPIRWYLGSFHDTFHPSALPAVTPADFEKHILERLKAYTAEELWTWLRHGRGPVKEAARALAAELPPPRSLSGALATLLERPRLAGARPFVDQLVSALTLPQRHPALPQMPIGGYADVTTHGHPDQILPSQFALDEWDFLRRHADRELLYFRREEPHAHTRQELVVLLDQGVRTWGDVRLVLSAAVLALGRQAERRRAGFLVATTSGHGNCLDPLKLEPEALAEMMEASDLSHDPGPALEQVLEQPADSARDVILLTHPRNLAEEAIRAAARRVAHGTRLFAMTLDARGHAELSELKHGVPVALRQFRVDFSRSAATVVPGAEVPHPSRSPWRGHVERVAYPFRFGTDGPIAANLFDFDLEGRWLLTTSRSGILHLWSADGRDLEVLPRAVAAGVVLGSPQLVLGVAGGFVVVVQAPGRLLTAHYEVSTRVCTVHDWPGRGGSHWWYSRENHAVTVDTATGQSPRVLNLASGFTWPNAEDKKHTVAVAPRRAPEAFPAWEDSRPKSVGLHRLLILNTRLRDDDTDPGFPTCYLDPDDGQLHLRGLLPQWEPFIPLADGVAALQQRFALEAQHRGGTLAMATSALGSKRDVRLYLFRGPPGVPLASYAQDHDHVSFALSSDGDLLARQVRRGRVEVRPITGGPPTLVTRVGGFSPVIDLLVGDAWLLLRTGRRHVHGFRWNGRELFWGHQRDTSAADMLVKWFGSRTPLSNGVVGSAKDTPLEWGCDRGRFVLGARGPNLMAATDRFGQVVLFNRAGEVVCMFIVFRAQMAAWLPDGTYYGSAQLTGRPPTPGAAAKIAGVLRLAASKET